MRLIDADKLKAVIIEGYRAEFFGSVLWDILNDIPTAYDVDKVVEELEEEREEKKKIYISGSISGNLEHYKEQFEKAELKLKAAGHEVLNPARNPGNDYKEYIDIGLFELMRCTAIYLLPGWKNSKGAKLEYEYAKAVGLEIMEE